MSLGLRQIMQTVLHNEGFSLQRKNTSSYFLNLFTPLQRGLFADQSVNRDFTQVCSFALYWQLVPIVVDNVSLKK